MIVNGILTTIVTRRTCIPDDYVREFKRFILKDEHVQLISWGTRILKSQGKWKVFTYITRKGTMETIWRKFVREKMDVSIDEEEERSTETLNEGGWGGVYTVNNVSEEPVNVLDVAECRVASERADLLGRADEEERKVSRNGDDMRTALKNVNRMGLTVFIALFGAFSKGQQESRVCVDYMFDTLVNSNFQYVEKIIRNEIWKVKNQKQFLKQVQYVKEFLKYFYYSDIGKDDDFFHSVKQGLYGKMLSTCLLEPHCTECKKPYQLLKNLKSRLQRENIEAHEAITDAMRRTKLCMGHKQQR